MKRILPLLALLALPAAGALPHPANYEFDYGAKFAVSGYAAGKPALSGFPVLVRIQEGSPSGFSYDDLQSKSTGADIAFVDMSGNGLPFEIDTWNPSGTSLIWVRLPSMQNGTAFVMCWGSATSGKTVCGTNPWSDYVGVWHLGETAAGATTVSDSSGNGLSGTTVASSSAVAASNAKIGGARHVTTNGQNSPGIDSGITVDLSDSAKRSAVDGLGTSFCASMWVRVTADFNYFYLIGRKSSDGYQAWGVQTLNNTTGQVRYYSAGTGESDCASPTLSTALAAKNQWHKIDFCWKSDGTYVIYQDGANKLTGDLKNKAAAVQGALNLSLGGALQNGSAKGGRGLNGDLDEVRLRAFVPDDNWAAADYATQNDASFLAASAAEELREKPEPAASVAVGSVQVSNAVATVSVSRLGSDASYVDVTVSASESADFSSTAWTTTYRVTGEDSRNLAVTGLEPFTTYYARAVALNNKGKSATTSVVSFKTKRGASGSSDKIVPGLEDYGALTLVDEIDCSLSLADDPDHRFREYPSGWSRVETILGVPTRTMAHKSDTCCYVSWRVGEGKGIVPNEPYVLVVDYPDEAPRSVTVFNFGNATRHGYHTGWTAGDSWSPPYVTQSIESWPVPYSQETKQLVQVMVPFEKSKQYNGSDSRIPMDTDGFDLNFGIIKAGEAPDSVGLAVSAIRLYKIDSYDVARPSIPYPAEGLPRRIVTSREEMGDNDDFAGFAHPQDFYKGRAKMIRLLGMNTCSKDLLEFGYMQNFRGDNRWGFAANYWDEIVDNLAEEDVDILPFYEYHGSRGNSGIGYMESLKPWTLNSAKDASWKYLFSNQSYVYNCMVDMTNDEALWDLQKLFQATIQPYLDKANFRGMWIRNRGGMPMGFNDGAIGRFNQDTGRNVTRAQIYNNGSYGNTDLYKAYRAWWYGKRCSIFTRLQGLISGQLPGAKVYYSNTLEEPGEFWANWGNPRPALLGNDDDQKYQGKNFNEYTGKNWSTSIGAAAGQYWPNALNADCPTWGNYEIHHSAPADDPHNYTNLNNVALCYPFNTVWTVADRTASARYRNKSGDLPFVRHYSLNENDFRNASNQEICGYYTCDWDHAGRAVMLSELYAMAYDDPTMLAYLFTANLVRNDSTYVREFNLNYLSLPALKGEATVGGGWPDTFTVRRWVTDKGTYWAVINCDVRPWSGTVDFKTNKTEIWYTVSGQPLPLTGGKASLSLEPFQMVCFTDVEPEHVDTPVFRYAFAEDVEAKAATLSVTLLDLGYQASSATVDWTLSGGPADVSSGRLPTYATHGTQTVRVTGLAPETEYTVSLLATNSKGKTATMEFTFRTALWPYVFQEPTAVTDAEGTTATASVKLTRADRTGALALLVGDEVKKTWGSVVAGTVYSGDFAISLGLVTRYRFVVERDGEYETVAEGRVLGRKTIGWIDIQLDKSAYSSWPFASAGGVDPLDGGTWTKSGANNISQRATDGGNNRIDLATEEDGYVRYSAKTDSVEGKKVRIEGRTQLAPEFGPPAALSPAPLAALALGKEGTVQTLYGYAASGWVAFPAFRVPSDGWIDWAADLDFDAGTVTYSAGDPLAALADGAGATALGIANASKKKVRTVTFVGSGAIDDFKGVYYFEEKSNLRVEAFDAALRGGATGLWFRNAGTSTEKFEIGIKDFEPGAYYAAFASDRLDAGPDQWLCVGCADAPAGASATFDLPADTSGRPALFFKVYRVTGDVMPNTPLSQLLGD